MENKLKCIRKTVLEIFTEYYEEIELAEISCNKNEIKKNIAKMCGAYQGLARFCGEVNISFFNDVILKCGFHLVCPEVFEYLDSEIDADLETEVLTNKALHAAWSSA